MLGITQTHNIDIGINTGTGIAVDGGGCGRHGGGLRGSHSGKKFSKTGHLWVTECKIFINGAFWALF